MKIRKFLHVLAIMFSSLGSMISSGHAEMDASKKEKKSGEGTLSRHHRRDSTADAQQDPPPQKNENNPPAKLSAALMASAERPSISVPMPVVSFPRSGSAISVYENSNFSAERTRYPWKPKIVTTTFWIGENATKNNPVPNHASSWDPQWAANYGGLDDPDPKGRKDFIPANFTPRQNPFYVALPYNDLEKGRHKVEAARMIPWFAIAYQGPDKSVCKGRWVAIRYRERVVYAQWEDCGPFRTDHVDYVFGNERPKPNLNHGAGLDVSPAVRDYLGMNDTDVTDWRFVDFDEVPEGPWAKHGDNNTFVINERVKSERLAQARDRAPVTTY